MSAREWQPGDRAFVKCSDDQWRPAVVVIDGSRWRFADGRLRHVSSSEARPVVEIDVADPSATGQTLRRVARLVAPEDAAALNSLADQIDPPASVPEPTDPAARVIDRLGREWARSADGRWGCITHVALFPTYPHTLTWERLVANFGPLDVQAQQEPQVVQNITVNAAGDAAAVAEHLRRASRPLQVEFHRRLGNVRVR